MNAPLDIAAIQSQFPILQREMEGRRIVYLDNAATSQTPQRVVDAITDAYTHYKANVHRGVHTLSVEATEHMELTRRRVAAYINAPGSDCIVFTRGTTEAINLVASSYGALLSDGDEVIVTQMEHHANIVPWQLLSHRKAISIKVAPLHPDGTLDLAALEHLFTPATRLVAVAHVSNLLGTVNPVKAIADMAHRHGARILIDGAQAVAHQAVDVTDIDADFYAFSAHKMYGPTGVGVLYAKRELLEAMPPYQGGGEMIGHVRLDGGTTWADVPYKFEAGTPDFIDIAAFSSALDFIEEVGIDRIERHGRELGAYAAELLSRIDGLTIYGTAEAKAPVIAFNVAGAHHYDVGMLLDRLGVAVRTGHHCAQPLMDYYGIEGTIRASFAIYNTRDDADALAAALTRILPLLRH